MTITPEVLRKCVINLGPEKAAIYAPIIKDVAAHYAINTPVRLAAFLAQVGHESASFFYTTELASGKAYDNREDLGNTHPQAIKNAELSGTTPGPFYKGRGLIQITGYLNYLDCSLALFSDNRLTKGPHLLTIPLNAVKSAGWYWDKKKLNQYADKNTYKSFVVITKRINGGTNGLADRLSRWEKAKEQLYTEV